MVNTETAECVLVNLSIYVHASTQIGCRWNTGISDGSKEDKWWCITTAISWCSTFKSFNCCRRCVLGHWTRIFRSKKVKRTVRSHDSFLKKKIQDSWKKTVRERGYELCFQDTIAWMSLLCEKLRSRVFFWHIKLSKCAFGYRRQRLVHLGVILFVRVILTTEVWVNSSERRKA